MYVRDGKWAATDSSPAIIIIFFNVNLITRYPVQGERERDQPERRERKKKNRLLT